MSKLFNDKAKISPRTGRRGHGRIGTMRHAERGSAIMMLFIMVALFGLLSFAFLRGTDGSTSWLQKEQSSAAATGDQDCATASSMAVKRLQLRGCGDKISYNADGSNNKVGAPTDGSCSIFHTNGGGVKYCSGAVTEPPCTAAQLLALSIGQSCSDAVYAGLDGSTRIYTTKADQGSYPWNNGTPSYVDHGLTSDTDGLSGTNTLVAATDAGAPYLAAQACRALGPKWYLPSLVEQSVLINNRNVGELAGSFNLTGNYWSTKENSGGVAGFHSGFTNIYDVNGLPETESLIVRCIRQD